MHTITLIARIILAFIFILFGLNGFLHFIPMPPHAGAAGEFIGILASSPYLSVVMALQFIGGALLLIKRTTPLGLVVLGPILVNILLFHLCLASQGLPLALVATLLWIIVFTGERQAFRSLWT